MQSAQKANVALDQVREMERQVTDALEKAEDATKAAINLEQQQKDAEQRFADAKAELESNAELLRAEKVLSSSLKDEIQTLQAKNSSLESSAAEEKKRLEAVLQENADELKAVKASIEDAKDDAYNKGVRETQAYYQADWARAKAGVFQEGWIAALKAAGISEGDPLYSNIVQPTDPVPPTQPIEEAAAATNGAQDAGIPDDPPAQG